MMIRITTKLFLVLILFALLYSGCSGDADVTAPPTETATPRAETSDASARMLWGVWDIGLDLGRMKVEITPARYLEAHYDITQYLIPPACDDCLAIHVNSFDPVTRILDADVTLINPFTISGHDVRGILYMKPPGHELVNPDGWTSLWDIPSGSAINPFKAFAKDETNRLFAGQTQHTENYRVFIPIPPQYVAIQFAVDASWPGNCKEPYSIDGFIQKGHLYDLAGVMVPLEVSVHDWQDDIASVTLIAPDITGEAETPWQFDGSTWTVDLYNNEDVDAGEYPVLIKATSGVNSLWDYAFVFVLAAPSPTVNEIVPPSGYQGADIAGVNIFGTGLVGPTCDVALKMDGEPDINATDVNIMDEFSIMCEISIPSSAALGLYDVEVTNGAGLVGTGENLFEVKVPVPDGPYDITPPWLNFSPFDVRVSGNYAYVASGMNGLSVFDVSSPQSPTWVNTVYDDGFCYALDISFNILCVAAQASGLMIYDISEPASPALITTVSITAAVDVVIVEGYAYVADETGYLQIVDIEPPEEAAVVKAVDTASDAVGVDVNGEYAYVAAADAGIKIISINPVSSAAVVQTVGAGGYFYDVEAEGGLALGCDINSGLVLVDIAAPESASIITTVTLNYATKVKSSGGYAYVSNDEDGIAVVNIDPPGSAAFVTSITMFGYPGGMDISGNYLYVVDYTSGLVVYDISAPAAPTPYGYNGTPGDAWDIAKDGDMLYIANRAGGIMLLNAADPYDVGLLKIIDTHDARGVEAFTGYSYVTNWSEGMDVVDVDPIGSADVVHTLDEPGLFDGIDVAGDYAYVAAWDAGIHIIDINPPESASWVKTVDTPDYARDVVYDSGYVYVADSNGGMHTINVDPPASASIVDTVAMPGQAYKLDVRDGYAYVCAGGLQIVHVEPVGSAAIVKAVTVPGVPISVKVSGDYAYIGTSNSGLQIVDINPITSASVIGSLSEIPSSCYGIVIDEPYAFIAAAESGLRVIRLW